MQKNFSHLRDADATRTPWGFLFACVLTAIGFSSNAQPVPKLNSVSPEWIQRGKSTDVSFSGENLGKVSGFLFADEENFEALIASPKPETRLESSGGGIVTGSAIDNDKTLTARITVSADAVGNEELRVESSSGVSNPIQLRISDVPEITEAGGRHALTNAQTIQLPVGISGVVGEANQTDFFGFSARQGEHLLFEIEASRTGSPLDSSLAIFDVSGKELIRNEDANGFDSFIDFEVPVDGNYILALRDFQHRGGGNYKYHLSAGATPHLDYLFPFGGQRGKPVEIALLGRNLGQSRLNLFIEANAPIGSQEVRAHSAKGFSNPRVFDVSPFAEFLENEPNDVATNANPVTLPGNFNGKIQKEKDDDIFKFKAEKGQRFIFEIFASRFGSKLDALLTLTDAKGTVLQRNDDAMGADARIDQTFVEAGDYFITVRDLLNRGSENFGYRLSAKPPAPPSFSAKILQDTLRIRRGGRNTVRIEVARADFGGPVEILGVDLPDGISVSPLLIPAEFPGGLLLINAEPDTALGNFPLKLIANGAVAGKKVSESVQPVLGTKRVAVTKKKKAAQKPSDKNVKEAFLTVLDATPFKVESLSLNPALEQNQAGVLRVEVQRNGFDGEIKLSLEGFSAANEPITKSVDVSAVTLKAKETRIDIPIKARLDSEIGTRPIFVRGEATVEGQAVVEFSRPVPLRISEFPFTLANSLPRLALTALPAGQKSAAGEAEYSLRAQRRGLFTEDIILTFEGLPEGIAATATNILRNTGEALIKLSTTEKAKPGTNNFVAIGQATVNGRTFQLRAPEVQLIVNAPAETNQTAAVKK